MVLFPPRYASSPAGLVAAETELDRLMVVHEGYAGQPNITKIWQGYVDKTADAVTAQREIVEHLRAAIGEDSAELGDAAAGRRQLGSNATPEPASCNGGQLG